MDNQSQNETNRCHGGNGSSPSVSCRHFHTNNFMFFVHFYWHESKLVSLNENNCYIKAWWPLQERPDGASLSGLKSILSFPVINDDLVYLSNHWSSLPLQLGKMTSSCNGGTLDTFLRKNTTVFSCKPLTNQDLALQNQYAEYSV